MPEPLKLRLSGFSYQAIAQLLGVSISLISQPISCFIERGIEDFKLGARGSKSYLQLQSKAEIMEWLKSPESRNISEL